MPNIDRLMIESGPEVYYTAAFRRVLEDHLTYLRDHDRTTVLDVEPSDAVKYQHDLQGLLLKYRIPTHHHWLVMRLNGMTSPTEMDDTHLRLMIPPQDAVDRIRQLHNTLQTIN